MTPEWVLGGNHRPYRSEWLKYPPQDDGRTYFFAGEHRNPSQAAWHWDEAVGHLFDVYDNGTLATIQWDDTGGDRDFDDLIVEVAVVRRPRYFVDLVAAERDETELERFAEEIEPKQERPDRSHAGGWPFRPWTRARTGARRSGPPSGSEHVDVRAPRFCPSAS